MAIFQGGNKAGGMFFPNGYQGWNFRQWASPPMPPRYVSVRGWLRVTLGSGAGSVGVVDLCNV